MYVCIMKRKVINISGLIGSMENPDGSIEKGVELTDVIAQVKKAEGEGLEVVIDSPGGNPDVAFSIADYLESVDANFVSIIKNLCGSAATVISLRAKPENRKMLAGSRFFIHNPSLIYVSGDADALARMSDYIRTEEDKFAKYYSKNTGLELEAVYPLMKRETEMTADEAKTLGFIIEILPALKPIAFVTKPQNQNPIFMKELKDLKDLVSALAVKVGLKSATEIVKKKIALVCQFIALDLTTKDGVNVVVETESSTPMVGDKVTVDGQPAPDGKYSFAPGVLVVAGGVITEVLPPDNADSEEVAALKKSIGDLTVENLALKSESETNKVAVSDLTKKVGEISKLIVSGYKPPRANAIRNKGGEDGEGAPAGSDYFQKRKAEIAARKKAESEKK